MDHISPHSFDSFRERIRETYLKVFISFSPNTIQVLVYRVTKVNGIDRRGINKNKIKND